MFTDLSAGNSSASANNTDKNGHAGKTSTSDRYRIWLLQAEFDLKAAGESITDGFFEWSCYQSVQAVEKALKAVIIHAGWRSPKTHKLGVLLSMCNRANDRFKEVKFNFRKIEVYTFISRYPFIYPNQNIAPHDLLKESDAKTCLDIATGMLTKVQQFLSGQKPTQQDMGQIDIENYYFTAEEVEQRVKSVTEALTQDAKLQVEKIILFGSFSREKLHPRTSTMDLLIVAQTELPFIERIQYVRELTKADEPIIEPLIYTPSEFDLMLKDEREGFVESAIDEGKVVYDKAIVENGYAGEKQ